MEKVFVVLQVVAPIFFAVFLGICARHRKILSVEEIQGMQKFIVKFCIPCLIFRSCLTAEITAQALSSMALLPPLLLCGAIWAFRARKKQFPYFNLPHLFCCKETGMMGIPLFVILFGVEQAYRMGVLDLAQALIGYPVMAILSADTGEDTSAKAVVKQMLTSPLIVLSILGVALNLTGIWAMIDGIGVGPIVTETISFLSQPVSAVMLFCVGYNFTLAKDSRTVVFQLTALHVAIFAAMELVIQGVLFLVPGVDAMTRWAAVMYCILPTSYLAPGLGRKQADSVMASGVCSLTTLVCLVGFCVITAIVA